MGLNDKTVELRRMEYIDSLIRATPWSVLDRVTLVDVTKTQSGHPNSTNCLAFHRRFTQPLTERMIPHTATSPFNDAPVRPGPFQLGAQRQLASKKADIEVYHTRTSFLFSDDHRPQTRWKSPIRERTLIIPLIDIPYGRDFLTLWRDEGPKVNDYLRWVLHMAIRPVRLVAVTRPLVVAISMKNSSGTKALRGGSFLRADQ
jgi:hypothetical protein